MDLRDDDDIYRAKLVYLGPPGYTLPVHLPYAEWGIGALLSAAFSLLLVLLTGDLAYIGAGVGLGCVATHFLWRYVDIDRPARAVVRTAVLDATAVQPAADGKRLPRLVASHITIAEIPKD